MLLTISETGLVKCLHTEEIPLRSLGQVSLRRASNVDPVDGDMWAADLSPVGGPVLGPFAERSEALAAEVAWLEENYL